MGDAQSAQREGKKDAAAEESGKVDDAQTEQHIEEKPLRNNGQISEINEKADGSIAEVNGYCDDDTAAEAIHLPDEDVSETEEPLKEAETPLENISIIEKDEDEADANENVTLEMTKMEAKQNDINEGFRKFFSNIGLKLTVKKGSEEKTEIATDVANTEEPTGDVEDTATETKSENAEQNTDVNTAQETYDNDSTTSPTMTDITSYDVLRKAEEKTTEAEEEAAADIADTATTSPEGEEKTNQDDTPEEPHPASPASPDQEVVISPIKKFFTTGIFSGLRKKKKPTEDETTEKELVDMGKKEAVEVTQDKEEISPGVETAAVETEHKENEFKEENLPGASAQMTNASQVGGNELEEKLPPTDSSTVIVNDSEILSSQDKDKVQASPLKRLLSGSSLKKVSKKQRSRTSSDTKLSDSGEHVSDQLLSSTETAEHQKEESPAQPSAEAAREEDSAWASFKKLVTPKKRMKRSSLSSEDTQIPGPVEVEKPSEEEQISDHSTEESKKRKDSSVSWEAVLCGSGRRRSRKTSDSEDETPQIENVNAKQSAESPLESSNEVDEVLAKSPKQAESLSEGDGGSTWKSFKRLVTPKRKAKDEEESKDNIQSDSEVPQDESSFSIKKLLPGRKMRKSAEKQDQVSSDEADKDVASGDDDSETPAVVPLSEFDTVETDVVIQTQADVESHVSKETQDYKLQQDLLDQMAEPVLPSDNLQTEEEKVQDNDDALDTQALTTSATNEEDDDDLTEAISKHQQLSDIPEEGVITETMATPASVTDEAARDDTIAEDLIEITSEAITAPEPVDITLTDETEMISAVSQLSESSKTSGNTTPVPAEYDVKETEALLQQVAETITITSNTAAVCSDDLDLERIVGSVSHQILETFATEEPEIQEIHIGTDASVTNTCLNVEELDAVNNLAATAQTESISDVNKAIYTEIVSEICTEEVDTAETAVDEVHQVDISQPEESIQELESTNERQHLEECLTEVNEAVSAELLPEIKEISTDEAEIEPPKMDSLEETSAAIEAEEIKDGAVDQEVQLETKDGNIKSVSDQAEAEDDSAVEELHILTSMKADTLDLKEGSDQTHEKEAISEVSVETVTDEPKDETAPLTEVNVEPENKDELNAELEAVQTVPMDSEEGSVESLEKKVSSEDVPETQTVMDEPKLVTEQNEELPVDEIDHQRVAKELEAVQTATLDSKEGEPVKKEVIPEATEAETVMEESEKETLPLTEVNVEPENEDELHAESETVQTATLDSEEEGGKPVEKEIMPEATEAETVTEESKEETAPLTEVNVEPENEDELNAELEAVQTVPMDSEEGSVESLEKKVVSEDVPETQTVMDEPKLVTEQNKELPVDEIDHQQIAEELEAVQTATLDSEEGEPVEKEVIPEEETETITEESKEETAPLTEVYVEPENEDELHAELEAVQTATLDSEEEGGKPVEKEVMPEATEAETVTEESKEEIAPLTEVNVEPENEDELPVDLSKTEHEEPEVLETIDASKLDSDDGNIQSVVKENKSAEEAVTEEPKEETEANVESEDLQVEAVKPEHVKEPELLLCDTETEAEAPMAEQEVTESVEEGSAPELEEQKLLEEEIPKPETEVASEEIVSGVVAQLDQSLEVNQDQKTQKATDDHIPEVVDELQTLTAVHVSSVEETSSDQVLEMTVNTEEHPALCVDIPEVTEEPKQEVHISEVQVSIDGEKESELPRAETTTATVEHAVVAQVITCNLKDVSAAIADVLMEKTSVINEPVIGTVANELQFKETTETATPLMKDDVTETAQEDNVVVMMHVPSVEIQDNHRVQVQVVDVNIKSAETIDTVLEVGVTEDKGVIDVCHETVKKIDNLSAIPKFEEELISEEIKVTIQEVKEISPETLPEPAVVQSSVQNEVVKLEQEVIKQTNAVTVDSVLSEVDNTSAITTKQQASDDIMQTPDIPGSSDVSRKANKEDLQETKAELQKSEVHITAEDATCSSEELAIKKVNEDTMEAPQIAQKQIATPSNTGLVVPQNTGIISSIGNVESPSSLSLEFKLNIQFGHAKAPVSQPPPTERTEPIKQTVVSEVGVQAVEEVEPIKQINPVESHKQTELTEVAVKSTEIMEKVASLESTETTVITNSPVLLDVGTQAMETIILVEETKSTERVISNIQATETIQPVRKTEKSETFLSQTVLSEACDKGAKAEEPVKQTEEEYDQDVWMDAEENINTQEETEVSLHEESVERKTDSNQEEKAVLEHEAPNSNTEAEEMQQEMHKAGGTCEVESEGEDFAVALEHPETASVTTTEWD
ncbi:hypothetical protein PAMP_005952 [Pampus punctatissimus]